MEELGSMWASEETMEEMKSKLLCAVLELESVKMEASEELKKYKDYIKHLLGLLKIAYEERDEARDQLHKLLDKLAAPPNPSFNEFGPCPTYCPGPQTDNFIVPAKANSTVTESNKSHSPVDSLLDVVSSPDSSRLVLFNQQHDSFVLEPLDIIDDLANGKVLPQKGKLLEAVMEAGPLLQTLLVAGPVPQWRDPPPLQSIRAPPVVSVKGCDPGSTSHRPVLLSPSGIIAQKPLSLGLYHSMPRANPQMCSASVLGLMGMSGIPYNSSHLQSSGLRDHTPMVKRQRFQ